MKGLDASEESMSSTAKIKTVDINEDGILTTEEHAAASQRMFAKLDADHDGKLTAAEVQAGHRTAMAGDHE
jgi:cephalosporin hydroxylase